MTFPKEYGMSVALAALPQLSCVPAREPETFSSDRHNPKGGAGMPIFLASVRSTRGARVSDDHRCW